MMSVYPYVVVLQYTHPKTKATEEHTIAVEAYSLNEALVQASVEMEAKHDYTRNNYEMRLLSVGPDTAKMKDAAAHLISELSGLMSPRKFEGKA